MKTWDTDDLPMMLREAAGSVVVALDGVTVDGILDLFDELAPDGMRPGIIGNVIRVWIQTGSLPGLAVGSTVTIDGAPYVVRTRLKVDDGGMSLLEFAKTAV